MVATFDSLQPLVKKLKEILVNNPEHKLLITHRFELYEMLGNLTSLNSLEEKERHINSLRANTHILTQADKIYAWLSILSVKKVLGTFENGILPLKKRNTKVNINISSLNEIPAKIIKLAEEILLGNAKTSLAWNSLNNEFYYAGDTIYRVYNYSSACIFEAACDALSISLGIIEYNDISKDLYLQQALKSPREIVDGDSPSKAMAAFAVTDNTPVHLWDEWAARKYSPSKKLEFWNWWLDDALPQAWKLLQNSNNKF